MQTTGLDYSKTYKAPASSAQCYACDSKAVGVTHHNGKVKDACKRHADPKAKVVPHCMYCATPVRKGSLPIDTEGDFAHRACYREDVRRYS